MIPTANNSFDLKMDLSGQMPAARLIDLCDTLSAMADLLYGISKVPT